LLSRDSKKALLRLPVIPPGLMPEPAEIVAIALAPGPLIEQLKRVAERIPVLGRIIAAVIAIFTAFNLGTATNPEVEREKRSRRKTRIEKQARYVLKASDAMQCVEDFLYGEGSGLVVALAKALRKGLSVPDVMTDEVFACIESKVLKQTGKRSKKEKKYFGRPAKGHGHGRIKKKR